jgi:hypothetical protein
MARKLAILFVCACAIFAAPAYALGDTPSEEKPCGYSPSDWCPAKPGDPCGRHHSKDDCRADMRCYGMLYRGESFAACLSDGRGFASNCPTVGCTSEKPKRR